MPRVLIVTALLLAAWPVSAEWFAVTQPGEFDGPVYDMCVFRGELIATGSFGVAGGVPARNIAAFDGERWRPLAAGVGTPPTDHGELTWGQVLAVYRDELWVGGRFTEAGGRPMHFLARWDGSEWRGVGEEVPNARVQALEVAGGALYVGGLFRYVGGKKVDHVARYNGRWSSLEQGTVGGVFGLQIFEGVLYVGGILSGTHTIQSPGAVYWQDANWFGFSDILVSADDDPVNVFDFHEHEGELYASGHFHGFGRTKTSGIARLQGNAWRDVDDGLGYFEGTLIANQMTSYEGDLVVVGRFDSAGRTDAGEPRNVNNIARLVDGRWRRMGGGTDDQIMCVEVYDGSLYIGGFFGQAGNVTSPIVARWKQPAALLPSSNQISMRSGNPTSSGARFSIDLRAPGDVSWAVFDLRGARVAGGTAQQRPAGTHELAWDGRGDGGRELPRGVYFMSVTIDGDRTVHKLTLLRED